MTTTSEGYSHQDWTGRLSPSDVHHVLFARAGLGRRGYDEVEVDGFLERVQQELTRLISEKADLRDEVSRLKSQLAQAQASAGTSAPASGGALSHEEANLQAVRLLAAAQQTADVYVADAEKYSQRLTVDAREHSEQMLEEARRAAKTMVAEAERVARDAASRTIEGEVVTSASMSKEELDQQIAYLKTFGQVVRVQLRAYLEALLRDVEDEWGRADPSAAKQLEAATPAADTSAPSSSAPEPRGSTALAAGSSGPRPPEADADPGQADTASNGARTSHVRPRKSTTVRLP